MQLPTAFPEQRFVKQVCDALDDYSPEVQQKALSAYYGGKKLRDTVKALRN